MSHIPLKGTKFKSRTGFTCIVVNYDDTSGKYIYQSPFKDCGYESYEWIIGNEIREDV